MPKTNRLREGLILLACAPAMSVVVGALIVGDIVATFRDLFVGDRAGLWGGR